MPYEKIDVTVRCGESLCENYYNGKCSYDGDIEDLDPNDPYCGQYKVGYGLEEGCTFRSLRDLMSVIEYYEDCVPFTNYDELSLRLICKSIPCPKRNRNHDHKAIFQISEETEKLFDFVPSVDGEVLVIPKSQLDLFRLTNA